MGNRVIRGPSITLEGTAFPLPDVMGVIRTQMDDDTENPDEVNKLLVETYANSDDADRDMMNHILSIVCGYTFDTLLTMAETHESLIAQLRVQNVPAKDGG